MAISFVAAGATANGSAPTVALPSGVTAGDLLLLQVVTNGTLTTPAGWALATNTGTNQVVLYKFATASETSVTLSITSGTGSSSTMVAYRGVYGVDVAASRTVNSTSIATSSVTATYTNSYVVSLYGDAASAGAWVSAPAGTTTRATFAPTGVYRGALIVDELQAAAGATTARTATATSSGNMYASSVVLISTPAVTYYDNSAWAQITANATAALPNAYSAGDLLVLHLISGTGGITTPTGWSLLTSVTLTAISRIQHVFYKYAAASETAPTISATCSGAMFAYHGVVSIDVFRTKGPTTGSSASTEAPTTVAANECILSLYAAGIANATWTAPASTTTRLNQGASSTLSGMLVVDEQQLTAGAGTSRTATLSGSTLTWGTVAIGLSPTALTKYWVGGSGAWDGSTGHWASSSGGAATSSAPASSDTVAIDTNSGTGTITCTGATCNDLTVTASQALTLGGASISVYGNLSLPSGGSFSGNTSGLTYTFAATSTGKTITTNAKSLSSASFLFNGSGGGWTLQDNLAIGNFSVNNGTVSLGATTVTVSGTSGSVWGVSGTGAISAGTSTIVLTPSTAVTFAGGGQTYYNVTISPTATHPSSVVVSGTNTFTNLTINKSFSGAGAFTIALLASQTVTGTLSSPVGSTAGSQRVIIQGGTKTITAAAVSLTDVDFYTTTGAGAATWTGTRIGDLTGNTGITFTAAKTVYWNLIGGASWNNNGWAATSGGSPATTNFPLGQDTAVFDSNSQVSSMDFIAGYGYPNIDSSTRSVAFSTGSLGYDFNILGDLKLGGNLSGTQALIFTRASGTQYIYCNGATISCPITIFNSTAGTTKLGTDFLGSGALKVSVGTFDANNFNVSASSFDATGTSTRTVTMGSGTWTLTANTTPWNVTSTGITLNCNTSTVDIVSTVPGSTRVFAGGNQTYYNLNIGGGSAATQTTWIQNANTFNNITTTKTAAHTIQFTQNITNTFANWNVSGSAGKLVTIQSSSPGAANNPIIAKSGGGTVIADYLSVSNITFTPSTSTTVPYSWYLGANSTNGGNNNGAAFVDGNIYKAYLLTSGTSWTVPSDWNSSDNEVHLIGAGGGGAGSVYSTTGSPNYKAAGGGGGGGGYTKVTNYSASIGASVTYAIGAGGTKSNGSSGAGSQTSSAGTGGATTWSSGAYSAPGGTGGSAATVSGSTSTSTGGSGGVGTTATGGAGGKGNTIPVSGSDGCGGGGGGGAGGPGGVGGAGGTGFISATTTQLSSGGGGGNGGGSAGGNATSGVGGAGGNNSSGTGGGTGGTTGGAGTVGGGGGGDTSTSAGGAGGGGVDVRKTIGGGGGRAGSAAANADNTSLAGVYGGGGGGGGVSITSTTYNGSAGAQGAILVVYNYATAGTSSNFFLLF